MMTKLHLTALFAVSALALSACSKNEDPSNSTSVAGETGDGDGDASTSKGTGDGDGDGDGDATTTAGVFVPDDDIPAANTCDPWAQDCPEDEKCAAWSSGGDTWDANKCVPILSDGKTGDECTYDGAAAGTDSCDVGFMCYYTNADGVGTCVPICEGTPETPTCPDNFNCSVSNQGSLLLCLYSCDPVLQDCQQDGTGCFWDGSQFNCDPAGELLEGDPCGYINDCSPGHVCLGAESFPSCAGSACCAGFCELDDPQCQIDGTECIAFFEEGTAPPGLENTGVCALPGA